MKSTILLLIMLCLLGTAPALANGAGSGSVSSLHSLGRAHDDNERMHERWLPGLNWQRQRERVVNILCEMGGLIALALVDCGWADLNAPGGKPLLLEPGARNRGASGHRELQQQSPESRMRSI